MKRAASKICLIGLFAFMVVLFAPSGSHALKSRPLIKRYELALSATLQYDRIWAEGSLFNAFSNTATDDKKTASGFSQIYSIAFAGYVIDPRIATFTIGTIYSDRAVDDKENLGYGQDDTTVGVNLNATLFRGINSEKGSKLWRNIPRPIHLRFSYYDHTKSTTFSYGVGIHYEKPGYIRFLSGKKFISYDDGKSENRNRFNRYRIKYNNLNLQNNNNGNGNGNGNAGNGNGNAGNGNGNANTNRNSNLNQNNRNNRNSNNNNNNNNNNANWNQNNINNLLPPQRGLFGFKFPYISLDFDRFHIKYKTMDFKSVTTSLNLRAVVDNPQVQKRKGSFYKSSYGFYYNMLDISYSDAPSTTQHDILLTTSHRWLHMNLYNSFFFQKYNGNTAYGVSSSYEYSNKYKMFNYSLGLSGGFESKDGEKSYFLGTVGTTNTVFTKKLSPKLTSQTKLGFTYARTESKDTNGRNIYNLLVTETLTSTHLKRFLLRSELSTGYTESGIPLYFTVSAEMLGLKKATLYGEYHFSTDFPKEDLGRAAQHIFAVRGSYRFRPNIHLNAYLSHHMLTLKNGESHKSKDTTAEGNLFWMISQAQSLTLGAKASLIDFKTASTSNYKLYAFNALYRARAFRRGSIVASANWSKNTLHNTTEKTGSLTYIWTLRRFSFSAEYGFVMIDSGQAAQALQAGKYRSHRVMFRITRTWGRSFRKLW